MVAWQSFILRRSPSKARFVMGGLGGVYALIELALETPLRISSRLNVSLLLGVGLLKVIIFMRCFHRKYLDECRCLIRRRRLRQPTHQTLRSVRR